MKEPKRYLYRHQADSAIFSIMAHSPRDTADSFFSCVFANQVWVRLDSPGSKWVLFRLVDGKATRAKSLDVGV